ncbi:MAG: hypothetical protein ACREAS_06145 [Nitrososphaera sp.]
MIATKMTALMLAVGMLAIGAVVSPFAVAYAQPVNVAAASNEDNDKVEQKNEAKIEQKSKIKCEAEVEDNDVIGVTGANVAANDCDSTQTAAAVQSNTNTDNDVQVASATADQEICEQIAALVGLNVQVCDQ